MLADVLEVVGIPRGDYVVKVNNRKVLNGVMEVAGVLDPSDPEKFAAERGIVLRAIDKRDRLGADGVRALLGSGRKDESGDFTKGANLSPLQIETIMKYVDAYNYVQNQLALEGSQALDINPDYADDLDRARYSMSPEFVEERADLLQYRHIWNQKMLSHLQNLVQSSDTGFAGVSELETMAKLLAAQGYGADRILIDPSVVRGLGYYTGPVYEAELTFPIPDGKGGTAQFGSVAGGGRYDDLVKRFTGQEVPATGVSIGVDRLLAALRAKGRGSKAAPGPVIVTVMDRDRMEDYQAMAGELRNPTDGGRPIRAEVYLGNPKQFGNQLKYADKRGSPIAVIQGADEQARGVVQIKDLILGAQMAATASLEEWKDRPSQFEVPRGELVARVRAILDAQK